MARRLDSNSGLRASQEGIEGLEEDSEGSVWREKDRKVVRERSAKGVGRRKTVVGVVREDRDRKVKDGRVERGTGPDGR